MNHELAKTLTTALVQFIDRERSEGTMCCSNAECVSIEKMFEGDKFDIIEAFIQKKLTRLTEFEQFMDGVVDDTIRETYSEDGFKDICKDALNLAKKELLSYADESNPAIEAMADLERNFKCDLAKLPAWLIDELNKAFKRGQESSHEDYIRGYTNGYKEAEKQYNESVAYHFPTMPTTPVFGCDGVHCTNPQMDCINCPRKTTGGSFSTSSASGTSAATLHGNTSVTDGKPHNPSFTD